MSSKLEDKHFRKFKEGDSSAFDSLFSNFYQPLFIFARKFVDDDLAKDFVQDCFYELWNNRNKIELRTTISAYLFTVVKNRCYKHFEKEKLKAGRTNEIEYRLKQEELNYFLNSEKSVLEFEIRDRIHKAIQKLPPKCNEIFTESRFNGLSNKEIAEKYNISLKSVEKHISKALKVFHEEFTDHSYLFFLMNLLKN